jgi:hypothetical protein
MPDQVSHYLIAPRETASSQQQQMLHEIADLVEHIPGASVVRRHGAAGDLQRVTISIPPEKTEELKARFGHGLIIESDEPLKY